MDITSLEVLLSQTEILFRENGIEVKIPQSWIIEGEDRISYTTLLRLIECCREYHWKKDILPLNYSVDSICGQINASFSKPLAAEQMILITYKIRCVFEKKYLIDFYIYDSNGYLSGYVDMMLYFYDPEKGITMSVPYNLVKGVNDK